MKNDHLTDWYLFLVNNSKDDGIYNLIHEGLTPDFSPTDPSGLIVFDAADLPKELMANLDQHIIKTAKEFSESGLVLIKNECVKYYLACATDMSVYEGKNSNYVQLKFIVEIAHLTVEREDTFSTKSILNLSDIVTDEDNLRYCWSLIVKRENKDLALASAIAAHNYLDSERLITTDVALLMKIYIGYNIVAVAYAWNNHFDEAATADSYYMPIEPLYPVMDKVIQPYLEMLMAKKQERYLDHLFTRDSFARAFPAHHEAYISLFVNPHYECAHITDMIAIVNRVNNSGY